MSSHENNGLPASEKYTWFNIPATGEEERSREENSSSGDIEEKKMEKVWIESKEHNIREEQRVGERGEKSGRMEGGDG